MSNDMDLSTGIKQAAEALGINPVDLATAISYETAGSFDPMKLGPTTQWGQHKGLIQWGEPQAKQYGVDWNNPIRSQLGSDGAIVRYLRDSGVEPGMGLLDVYSAINAGQVGKYGASDASSGGAPGTVADKVNTQMAGHREKAIGLIGGEYVPPPPRPVPDVDGGEVTNNEEVTETIEESAVPLLKGLAMDMLRPKPRPSTPVPVARLMPQSQQPIVLRKKKVKKE